MKRRGKCIFCFEPVKSGGGRHAKGGCSRRGVFGEHRRGLKHRRRNAVEKSLPQRGVTVAGVGGAKAASHRKKAKGVGQD